MRATITAEWRILALVAAMALLVAPTASAQKVVAVPRIAQAAADEPAENQEAEEPAEPDPRAIATHEQIDTIKIGGPEEPLRLATFCLAPNGNLVTACQAVVQRQSPETPPEAKPGRIVIVSPEGESVKTIKLDFSPQGVNVGEDGTIYAGGTGTLVKLDADGNELLRAETPTKALFDIDELVAKEQERMKQQAETYKKQMEQYRERLEEQSKKLQEELEDIVEDAAEEEDEDNDDEDDDDEDLEKRKAQIEQQLLMINNQLKMFARQAEAMKSRFERTPEQIRASIEYRFGISGITVTGDDVFVVCRAVEGYGFDVYRLDKQLANPEKIVSGLRGCCGQMDVQAGNGKIFAAENSRKKVVCFDRDGEEEARWGNSSREAIDGFGSCCNPMNLRFGPAGEVFTSESNVGAIKRFSPEGEFLGLVCKAELVPGCKHVAIAVNDDASRVYMLDITRSQIYVFAPAGETSVETSQ